VAHPEENGNHPYEDLAKSGYKPVRKYKLLKQLMATH
jgi:hypothetical protein